VWISNEWKFFNVIMFRLIEDTRKEKEQEKQIRKEERSRAREKAREEKRMLDDFFKEWNRPKDDLMCEDLKVKFTNHKLCLILQFLFLLGIARTLPCSM